MCVCVCARVHVRVCMHASMHECVCGVCAYVCVCVCVYVLQSVISIFLHVQVKKARLNGRRSEAWKEEALDGLERMREGHRQSDKRWNRFKCNDGENYERWSGVHIWAFSSA